MPTVSARRSLAAAVSCACVLCATPSRAEPPRTHFESDVPGLELSVRTANFVESPVRVGRFGVRLQRQYVFATICEHTPCDADLRPGRHHLALNKPGAPLVEDPTSVRIDGPADVRATYTDRSDLRTAGWVITGVGLAGGFGALMGEVAYARDHCPVSLSCLNPGLFVGTLVGFIVVPLVGIVLALQPDSVKFAVSTISLGGLGRREGVGAALPDGLALTFRF